MNRPSIDDIEVLLTVATEGSFTRAAAKIGVSQSALSQTVRNLEARMGVRLLTRTTRSVSPTEAGIRLLNNVGPKIDAIRDELTALDALRDKPTGTIRLTADEQAAEAVLWPALSRFLPDYPDIKVELLVDNGLIDIVAERFDAGVRLGEIVAQDMISVPISGDQRMLVVGSPTYLSTHGAPATPDELLGHRCINLRLPTHGGLYVWEFERDGQELNIRVENALVFNNLRIMMQAALAGFGLAYLPEERVRGEIDTGRLEVVLKQWSPAYPGYRLYYPSRRHHSPAFALLLKSLRATGCPI
jgi:DNA-binding transcriptional LysR family regulator